MSQKTHSISLGLPRSPQESIVVSFPVRLIVPEERKKLEKKAVRRIDFKLLPFIATIFLLTFMARSSSESTIVGGMQKDFPLTMPQFQFCTTLLFVPYISLELPSTLLLRTIGPNVLISASVAIWGVVLILFGLITDGVGLANVRALLGVFLWPTGPSMVCYLSGFYTRKELSIRIAVLFSLASLFSGLSGLMAGAMKGLNGVGGKPAWAWLLMLNGVVTLGHGVAGYFVIPATPRDAKFLTPEQKEFVMARLERDRPSIVPYDQFSLGEMARALRSPHVLAVSVLLFMVGTALFGLAMTISSTVSELGFLGTQEQLLGIGPFALGFFATLRAAYISDHYRSRGITTAVLAAVAVAGYSIFFATSNKFVAYGSLYLTVPGMYATTPPLFAWLANNSEPYYRRATSIGIGFMAANLGCNLSIWLSSANEGPKYRKTALVNLLFAICIALLSLFNVVYLSQRNKCKKNIERREALMEKYNEDEDDGLRAWTELGDAHPDFQYTL